VGRRSTPCGLRFVVEGGEMAASSGHRNKYFVLFPQSGGGWQGTNYQDYELCGLIEFA
jgi:hypothetical protein